jgi:hypothetical protein
MAKRRKGQEDAPSAPKPARTNGNGANLGFEAQLSLADLFGHPEGVLAKVLVWVLSSLRVLGYQRRMPHLEGVRNGREENQPERYMLVVGRLQVFAQLIGTLVAPPCELRPIHYKNSVLIQRLSNHRG